LIDILADDFVGLLLKIVCDDIFIHGWLGLNSLNLINLNLCDKDILRVRGCGKIDFRLWLLLDFNHLVVFLFFLLNDRAFLDLDSLLHYKMFLFLLLDRLLEIVLRSLGHGHVLDVYKCWLFKILLHYDFDKCTTFLKCKLKIFLMWHSDKIFVRIFVNEFKPVSQDWVLLLHISIQLCVGLQVTDTLCVLFIDNFESDNCSIWDRIGSFWHRLLYTFIQTINFG